MGTPKKQPQRSGFWAATDIGNEWEIKQVGDLHSHLGPKALLGRCQVDQRGRTVFVDTPLDEPQMLRNAQAGTFLVQASYDVLSANITSFATNSGLNRLNQTCGLEVASVRPDLIEVLAPRTFEAGVRSSGELEPLAGDDTRLQLRVIDIKLTSEPGASHFVEVAYYTMALAGWLDDETDPDTGAPLSVDYVVVPAAAVWPGSHDLSAMVQLVAKRNEAGNPASLAEKIDAMHGELEIVEFDVFRFRLRRLFHDELPEVLAADWMQLPLHVNTTCKHCDYLGYPWQQNNPGSPKEEGKASSDSGYCYPTAERTKHLSRLPFMSRGQRKSLEDGGTLDVDMLAGREQSDTVFDTHQRLKTSRNILPYRAASLINDTSGIAPQSGGAATLPNFVNLRVFITAAFEVSTAVSFAFGMEAFWRSATPWGWHGDRRTLPSHAWRAPPHIVDQNDVLVERRVLLQFLNRLQDVLTWDGFQEQNNEPTRLQIYIWDQLTYDHLCRVIGRHLDAILGDRRIRNLAWLFPAEDLLQNSDMASRAGAITILGNIVQSTVAVPVPHQYSLLEVAREYQRPRAPDEHGTEREGWNLWVHPLFEDRLSSQIPSERAHDVWARGLSWQEAMNGVVKTMQMHLFALRLVQERLVSDLRAALPSARLAAPALADLGPSRPINGKWNLDAHLWLSFAKLDNAMSRLEKESIRAMPVHEREARGKSAVFTLSVHPGSCFGLA